MKKFSHKKLLTIFILITMTLFMVACGGNDQNADNGNNGESEEAKKITIFQNKVEIAEQLEELAEEYEEETGVEVEVWGITGDGGYFPQLTTRLNSNQGPTIFNITDIAEAIEIESYLYDMSDESYMEYVNPNMELEIDGKIVGLPYGIEGFGLIYNKDLISPEEITDLDSFVDKLKEFEGEGIDGLQLSQEGYFLIGHISNHPFSVMEDNVEFMEKLEEGEVSLAETEEFQEFAKFMEAIREHTTNPLEIDYDTQIGNFASGETAMIHQGNWANLMFEDYDLDFEMGMMPFPIMGNDKLTVDAGSSWAINGTKDNAEIKAANDFLHWLVTSDTGHRYIVEEFNFLPPYSNVETDELDPLSEAVFDASDSGETIPWSHKYYPPNLVQTDWVPVVEQFFLSDMSGLELVEQLEEVWLSRIND